MIADVKAKNSVVV